MTALLDAVARVFVAPSSQARPEPVAVASSSAAVCGRQAEPLACALALALRARGAAVVCTWAAPAAPATAPPTTAARRLAASMQSRNLSATASGRLVLVRLDDDPRVAASEAGRASAAAGDVPVVTAICGPREPAFDDLLTGQSVTVVAAGDGPEELVRLAVATLGSTAVAAPALGTLASWMARSGMWVTPAARRALAGAQAGLR